MASTADVDANMNYLMLVIKNAEFKPNYRDTATEAGISSANNAQKKFKKLVENAGFGLVNGAVVSLSRSNAQAAPVTPAKTKGKKAETPASKKRKVQESDEEEEDGEVREEPKCEEEK